MPDNELSLGLNVQRDIDELKRFQQELKNTKALAADAVASFRSGTGTAADARQAINVAAQAGTGGIQGSASSGSSGGATPASQMAAAAVQGRPADVAAFGQFQKQYPGLSQSAYQSAAAQFGVTMGVPQAQSFSTNQAAVALAQSAGLARGQWNASDLYAPPSGGYGPLQGFTDPNKTISFSVAGANARAQNDYLLQMQRRQAVGMAGLSLAAVGVSSGFNVSADQTLTGRVSPTAIGGGIGGTIGGGIGAGIGTMIAPGIGTAIGLGIGNAIGTSIGNYIGAPVQKGYEIFSSIAPIAGLQAGGAYGANMHAASQWAQNAALRINNIPGFEGRQNVTAQSLGAGYGTAAGAFITGGINPFQAVGTQVPFGDRMPLIDPVSMLPPNARRGQAIGPIDGYSTGRMVENLRRSAINQIIGNENSRRSGLNALIDSVSGQDENLAQLVSRRIHTIYPDDKTANSVIDRIAPIYGSLPETGGNYADILTRFGSISTYQSMQGLGKPPIELRDLMQVSTAYRSAGRAGQFAALQTRGSGAALQSAYGNQMYALGSLPGGSDSLSYAQARAGFREAGATAFEQSSMTTYGIPQAQLAGAMAVADVMPYAPGQRVGLQAASIRNQRQQAIRIQQYMSQRRESGMLSEQEELSLTQQLAGLQAGVAGGIASIAEGGANLLMGLSSHMPGGMSKFTSLQQGALFMGGYNPFRRSSGAFNGRAANIQDSLYQDLGVPTGPYSRSGNVNQFGGRAEALLERIANAMDRMAGNGRGSFPGNSGGNSGQDNSGRGGGNFN